MVTAQRRRVATSLSDASGNTGPSYRAGAGMKQAKAANKRDGILPIIAARFPLLEAARANELMESGQVTGNIVLLSPELLWASGPSIDYQKRQRG